MILYTPNSPQITSIISFFSDLTSYDNYGEDGCDDDDGCDGDDDCDDDDDGDDDDCDDDCDDGDDDCDDI